MEILIQDISRKQAIPDEERFNRVFDVALRILEDDYEALAHLRTQEAYGITAAEVSDLEMTLSELDVALDWQAEKTDDEVAHAWAAAMWQALGQQIVAQRLERKVHPPGEAIAERDAPTALANLKALSGSDTGSDVFEAEARAVEESIASGSPVPLHVSSVAPGTPMLKGKKKGDPLPDWDPAGPKDPPRNRRPVRTQVPYVRSWASRVIPGNLAPGTSRKKKHDTWGIFCGDTVVVTATFTRLQRLDRDAITSSVWDNSIVGSGWSVSKGKWLSENTMSWSVQCGGPGSDPVIKVGITVNDGMDIYESHTELFQQDFVPELAATPGTVALDTGKRHNIDFEVKNLKEAGSAKLVWEAQTNTPEIVGSDKVKATGRGKARLAVEGLGAGTGEIQGNFWIGGGKIRDVTSIKVPVTVSSDAARAAKTLHDLSEKRRKGESVQDREQVAAENKAISSSQSLVKRAKGSQGTEVEAVRGSIRDQILTIEGARADGYGDAVNHLNAKGMDKKEDYSAFNQALLGNLLWALSGVIPAMPLVAMATKGLLSFFAAKWSKPGPAQSAVVGTVGAMLAQFSALPSGSSTSGMKINLQNSLTDINSTLCNALKRAAVEYIAGAVAAAPPEKHTDIVRYMTDLELGVRHALYGDVYRRGLNDGDLPMYSKIRQDARDQMLRQYVVATGALDNGNVAPIRGLGDRVQVSDAVELLGGPGKLNLAPYELVENQMRTVSAEMGVDIKLDFEEAVALFEAGKDVHASVNSFDEYKVFGYGMPTRWMNPLMMRKIVSVEPEFSAQAYLSNGNITSISKVTVKKNDLERAKIGGKTVYSAKLVRFTTHGVKTTGFISVDPPPEFEIRYKVKP